MLFHRILTRSICLVLAGLIASSCSKSAEEIERESLQAGDRHFAEARYPEALIEYRKALQAAPRSGQVRLRLAKTYLVRGDVENAAGEAIRAADLLPNDPEAQLLVSRLMILGRDFEGAKKRALAVLAANPRNSEAEIVLGNALAELKDLEGALKAFGQAIDKDPQNSLGYTNLGTLEAAKGNRAEAEAAFKRAVAANPNSDEPHLALANLYWAAREYEKTESELLAAVKAVPASPLANLSLATFYVMRQQPERAIEFLKTYAAGTQELTPKLTLADFYVSLNRVPDATALLEELAKRQDGFALATIRLASLDYNAGRRDAAKKRIDQILERDRRNEEARLMRVRHLIDEGKAGEAVTVAKSVVADNSKSARGYFFLGNALVEDRSHDEAVSAYQEALRLSPTAVPAQLQLARLFLIRGDGTGAAQFAQQAIANAPQNGEARLILARALLSQGNVQGALIELNRLAAAAPKWSDVHVALGLAHMASREPAQARKAFETALSLNPAAIDALSGLASLDVGEKRGDSARARVEARAKAAPNDPAVVLLLGQTYLALNQPRLAEQAFRKVLQLDSSNLDAFSALARIFVVEKRLDEAIAEFSEIVRRRPKDDGTITMIGMIHEIKGQPAEARKRYEQALAVNPESGLAANNLAMAYVESGENLDLALNLARTAKARLPNRHEIDDTLGWVYYKKNLSSLAIGSFKLAVAAQPENPVYLYHLGAAYAQAKDDFSARRNIEKALKIRPDFTGADDARRILGTLKN
jgi:tetratricopeptide (TPR) repeat protein